MLGGGGGGSQNDDFADPLREGWGVKVQNADVIFEWELYEKYASVSCFLLPVFANFCLFLPVFTHFCWFWPVFVNFCMFSLQS